MRRIVSMLCLWSLCMGLGACGAPDRQTDGGGDAPEAPLEVVEAFFDAFAAGDYAAMEAYCTQACVETYFHEQDVNGMVWASAVRLEEASRGETECAVMADVEMETAQTSALYGETETTFYVILQKTAAGAWAIDRFATGL